ncbi:sialate O-acetylesterase [uncultured Fibrella sp.]|uniref:sialate O-acetylesterase n=1 Tax=uncultured Fibrella sp. TaxID=1284596 RepID=UPI0035CA6457
MTVPRDPASLVVSWPYSGSVFQRNNSGTGKFVVQGSLNSYYVKTGDYQFVAELTPLQLISGQADISKSSIDGGVAQVTGNGFRFSMENIPAGWYALSVTAFPLAQNLPIYYLYAGKVGIGEVFIIAGQSNAQGLPNGPDDLNVAYPLPSYDAVRVQPNAVDPNVFVNYASPTAVDAIRREYLQPTVAAKDVATNQGIAPAGGSLWYWARVGERLAAQYGVPVAFYNAAWGGTTIKAWEESKDGTSQPLGWPVTGSPRYSPGSPYRLLRASLNLYGSSFGVRSVLWLQGETDVKALGDVASWGDRSIQNAEEYRDKLHAIIQQTRQDFGAVPWVVGKTSYNDSQQRPGGAQPQFSDIVRTGQSLAVSTATARGLAQVFGGPDTDQFVTARRFDVVHFGHRDANDPNGTDGLAQAANAWFDNLHPLLSSNALVPVTVDGMGTLPQLLSISDDGVTATTMPGYTTRWVADNGSGFDLTNPVAIGNAFSGTGDYRAVLTNGQGNRIVTQTVHLPFRVVNDVQSAPNACYTINVDQTGKRLQAMGDNSVQQQTISNAPNQIWKLDDRGNGQVSFTSQDGTGRVIQTVSNPTEGVGISLGSYTGTYQHWALQSNPLATNQWRVYSPTTNNTWDLQGSASLPLLQIYGNTSESFATHRSFRFETTACPNTSGGTCNFTLVPSTTDNDTNRSCGQATTLNANCSGGDCGVVTYSWIGNGISGSNSSISFNVPSTNGSYDYTVTATKAGCNPASSTITINVSGCSPNPVSLPLNACYTINVDQTGKRLQAMGDNSVQQQAINNVSNQVWKLDDRGNGQVSFTSQDGTSRVIQANSNPADGVGISLGGYTGTYQHWALQFNPSATNQWRVYSPTTNNTWDLQGYASLPALQIYGNTSESFYSYRSFRLEATNCSVSGNCNFALTPTISDNNPNRSCSQAVTLNANCSGADCGVVTYGWSGNGISGSGSSINFNVPGNNSNYTYTITASKTGCNPVQNTVAINVSGCGGTNPCAAFTVGTQVAYRSPGTGDPSVKIVVSEAGGCKRAVWSDGSGAVNRDWLPYVTANPGFNLTDIANCLKFSDEPCGARLGMAELANDPMSLELIVAPNPNDGQFTVRFQTQAGQVAMLRLSDVNGRSVRPSQTIEGTGLLHEEAIKLPVSVHGMLLLEVVSGQQRGTRKILID